MKTVTKEEADKIAMETIDKHLEASLADNDDAEALGTAVKLYKAMEAAGIETKVSSQEHGVFRSFATRLTALESCARRMRQAFEDFGIGVPERLEMDDSGSAWLKKVDEALEARA